MTGNDAPAYWRAKRAPIIDERRTRVAMLKLRGLSIGEIAAALAEEGTVNPSTHKPWSIKVICEDLQVLQASWKASAAEDTDEWIAQRLAGAQLVEREAWAAWKRGIGKKQETVTKRKTGRGDGYEVLVKAEEQNGDPRYLSTILAAQERQADLLGLDAPKRNEHSGPRGKPVQVERRADLSMLTDDELNQMKTILERAAERESAEKQRRRDEGDVNGDKLHACVAQRTAPPWASRT